MPTLSRLSDLNISNTDPLKLAPFYKELRTPDVSWPIATIMPNETMRMDLISYRLYGDRSLIYVFQVILGLDDLMDKVVSGTEFQYPTESWLRERIKYWENFWANK